MTSIETTQYEKALAKATIENLHIVGKGRIKATGQVFYAVTASDGTGCYSVIVAGHTLVCNCKAGQAGRYCKHRALARHEIVSKAAIQAALDAQQERDRVAHETATGQDVYLPYRPTDSAGVHLYRTGPTAPAFAYADAPADEFVLTERVKEEM
jgi:hypothetical protein